MENNTNNQHLKLGRIAIDKQVTSIMESDSSFHNFVYNCLMIHETGECERCSEAQIIKSTHQCKLSGVTFDIATELSRTETIIILSKKRSTFHSKLI